MSKKQTLSVIVPVYNEKSTVLESLARLNALSLPGLKLEVIIVDDASTDGTSELLQQTNYKILRNSSNLGKSQSVKRGILTSTGDWVVIHDADLEYHPADIVKMLDLAEKQNLDVIYGNRFGKANPVIYWQNYIGNQLLSLFSNLFTFWSTKIIIPDVAVCYKLVKGDVLRELAPKLTAVSSFGFEIEVTAKLAKLDNLRWGTTPISYAPRTIAAGKKIRIWPDGVMLFWEVIRYNLFS